MHGKSLKGSNEQVIPLQRGFRGYTMQSNDYKRKAHTGEHILFRALFSVFEGMYVKKVELGDRNYFLVHYDKDFEWQKVLEAEKIANRIIAEKRPVTKVVGTKEEVKKQFPHLRVRWDRITSDTVTVIQVKDYDWAACVGDHVENTGDIEYIVITRINAVGKGFYEIEFEVADTAKETALERAALARQASVLLKTSMDKVLPTVKNLKKNNETLTESVRTLTTALVDTVTPEYVNGVSVYITSVPGGDLKTLQRAAAQLSREGAVLAVFAEETQHFVVAARSPSVPVDCTDLLSCVLSGKGGGKPEYAVYHWTDPVTMPELTQKIKQFVKQSTQKANSSSPKSP